MLASSVWKDLNLRRLGSEPSTLAILSYTLLCLLIAQVRRTLANHPTPLLGAGLAGSVNATGFEPVPTGTGHKDRPLYRGLTEASPSELHVVVARDCLYLPPPSQLEREHSAIRIAKRRTVTGNRTLVLRIENPAS